MVAPGAHAVLLVDQARWHLSERLVIPANITILPMPPKSPELNPVENIWQFMRHNRLFQILRRSRRPAMEDHVHWSAPMGARVLIKGSWYYTALEQRWDARVSRQLLSSGPAQLCDARVGRKTFAVESDAELWRFADRLRTRFAKANVPSLLI